MSAVQDVRLPNGKKDPAQRRADVDYANADIHVHVVVTVHVSRFSNDKSLLGVGCKHRIKVVLDQ